MASALVTLVAAAIGCQPYDELYGLDKKKIPAKAGIENDGGKKPDEVPGAPPDVPDGGPAATPVVEKCAPADPSTNGVELALDLPYAKVSGETLSLDIASPKEKNPGGRPLVVVVHGGAWIVGDKSQLKIRETIKTLAAEGWVAAAIDYRLARVNGENAFPAAVSDARCALRWLRRHATEHGIDRDRVGILGGSAGAQISALVALAPDAAFDDGTCDPSLASESARVRAFVGYYGVYDFRTFSALGATGDALLRAVIGDGAALELASPILHVGGAAPPALLVHGTEDELVDHAQSVALAKELSTANASVTYVEIDGARHGFSPVARSGNELRGTCTMLAHFRRTL